eukprot:CAMPEP_0114600686 /NCGR_PEP_ID=MMETSP0125-20121206/23284_1 /TAXON_ID=485358 ORGANISM="Aristerostoma sp., Strain ATCC 50986" /NCGR_SAMPLE_ID=MMETSP0125 /ASSEMBLY_ACC=CAM_ASM_000245 /LENGTH=423 /DNA_ID=CAMNT_0001809121 /DNA_START=570 /DNA_END=1841 /DNA_ORIENTATION=+
MVTVARFPISVDGNDFRGKRAIIIEAQWQKVFVKQFIFFNLGVSIIMSFLIFFRILSLIINFRLDNFFNSVFFPTGTVSLLVDKVTTILLIHSNKLTKLLVNDAPEAILLLFEVPFFPAEVMANSVDLTSIATSQVVVGALILKGEKVFFFSHNSPDGRLEGSDHFVTLAISKVNIPLVVDDPVSSFSHTTVTFDSSENVKLPSFAPILLVNQVMAIFLPHSDIGSELNVVNANVAIFSSVKFPLFPTLIVSNGVDFSSASSSEMIEVFLALKGIDTITFVDHSPDVFFRLSSDDITLGVDKMLVPLFVCNDVVAIFKVFIDGLKSVSFPATTISLMIESVLTILLVHSEVFAKMLIENTINSLRMLIDNPSLPSLVVANSIDLIVGSTSQVFIVGEGLEAESVAMLDDLPVITISYASDSVT